jgi:serine protease Do
VKVWRDGHENTLEPVIAAMPAHPERVAQNDEDESASPQKTMGLRLESLTNARRGELHVAKGVKGVVVAAVAQDSPLAQIGVQQGDVIEAINRVPVATPQEAREQFAKLSDEKGATRSLLLLLNRHGINQYVAMTVEQGNGNG